MEIIFIICMVVLFLFLILSAISSYKRNTNNGATLAQQYVGKKFGELCTDNAMCGSNKCVNNVCVW